MPPMPPVPAEPPDAEPPVPMPPVPMPPVPPLPVLLLLPELDDVASPVLPLLDEDVVEGDSPQPRQVTKSRRRCWARMD